MQRICEYPVARLILLGVAIQIINIQSTSVGNKFC